MPARIYSRFATNKITQPANSANAPAGKPGKVVVKQSFTSQALPGKPSNWYKAGSGKVYDVASRKG